MIGRTGRRRIALAIATAATAGSAGCSFVGSSTGDGPAVAEVEVVSVASPASAVVGTDVDLEIIGDGTGLVLVDVTDPFATSTFELELDDGTAGFSLPDSLTSMSGVVDVTVRGVSTVAATTVELEPEPTADGIVLHVGPRTIVAGGDDLTMAVAIAADRFGNPVEDGTTLDITTVDGDGASDAVESTATVAVEGGVASERIPSDDVAGTVDVFATDGPGASSGRRRFVEVAATATAPDVVSDVTVTDPLVADGRSVFTVRTTTITDRFENVVPDGHLVRLAVDGPDGSGRLSAKTIDGVARFDVVAPARPGRISFTASVDGDVGTPLVVDARSAVSALPVDITTSGDGFVIEVGPVLDERGAAVVDGIVAAVRPAGDAATAAVGVELDDGVGSVMIDLDDLGDVETIEVEVLGTVERVRVP